MLSVWMPATGLTLAIWQLQTLFFLQFPCQSIMCHLLAITTYLYEYFFTSLSQFPLIVSWVYTWFKLQCIDKPVYTVRTHYMQAFSGPNCFILFFALWWICLKGIFFMNKGFDAYSYLCEMGVVLFPEGSCTVQTSLVVTHSVYLSRCHTSWILLTMFVICWFCLMKFGWCHLLHCWNEILLIP